MATKMNDETAKRVKSLGINAKSEEEARKALLDVLVKNGIDGMEDQDTDTLIEIAESFIEEGDSSTKEVETKAPEQTLEEEEKEYDELANEVSEEEETEEEEEDTEEGDKFDQMDRSALKAYNKEQGLNVSVKKSMTDDDLRNAIRTAEAAIAEANEAEAEEAEPEEEKKPVKKAKKEEAPKSEKKEEKKPGKRGIKLDPRNNTEDAKKFECLEKLFPTAEYAYAWLSTCGVTIKRIGKNSQRGAVTLENCTLQNDGSIKLNMYLLTLTKKTEVLDDAGIEYELCWSGAPMMKGITMEQALEILNTVLPHISADLQKIDKRLGDNRAKMEQTLNKKSAKEVAPASEEEKKPVKKAKK